MKKTKDKSKKPKTVFSSKDFIPPNLLENTISQSPITYPSNFNTNNNFHPNFEPNEIPQIWPESEDEIEKEINEEMLSSKYFDEEHEKIHNNFPLYLIQFYSNNIEWNRPSTYVVNYYLDKEIKFQYPKKNYVNMREDIKSTYEKIHKTNVNNNNENEDEEEEEDEEQNLNNYLKNDQESMKATIYKDFYIMLDKKIDYKIVSTETKIETDEEYLIRKQNELNTNVNKKKQSTSSQIKKTSTKKNINNNNNNNIANEIEQIDASDKIQITKLKPSNLNISEFTSNSYLHNSFYSWITSIFQMILDLNIPDIETGKNIIQNIYPQKNNIPVYNPKGKYLVKLYLMGKPRKIVIDDRMPCNRNNEIILPQCTLIEELWPQIFVKALLKVNYYKSRHPLFFTGEEFMDVSVIYELTGMHVILLDLDKNVINLFSECFKIKAVNNNNNNNNLIYENKEENNNNNKKDNKNKEKNKNNVSVSSNNNETNEEEKFYLGIFSQKQKKFMLNKNETFQTYYEIVEAIDFKNERSGQFLNSINKKKKYKLSGSINKRPKQNINSSIIAESPAENNSVVLERKSKKYPTIIQQRKKLNKNNNSLISSENILFNFLYSIEDFFQNEKFNMKRLRFLDFSDLQKQFSDDKVQFKQLAPNEKKTISIK